MIKQEIVNDENMGLWFYPDLKCVHHERKKPLPPGGFEKLLSKGAEYVEKHGATKWLSDESNLIAITPEDNEWADSVWAPRVIKAGFKHWAVVMPKSAVGNMQMKRFVQEYRDRGVTVEIFDSIDAAIRWLDSK